VIRVERCGYGLPLGSLRLSELPPEPMTLRRAFRRAAGNGCISVCISAGPGWGVAGMGAAGGEGDFGLQYGAGRRYLWDKDTAMKFRPPSPPDPLPQAGEGSCAGDERAQPDGELFSRLLVGSMQRIYGFILTLVHDRAAANDILQEVSAVLWRKFDRFEPGTDFGAWAMSVARLSVFEWRRRQKHLPLQLDDEQLGLLADEAVAVSCEFEARREALRGCFAKLASRDQELLVARYHQGQSVVSIADGLSRTRVAIYKRLDKLHALLLDCIRRHLAAEGR